MYQLIAWNLDRREEIGCVSTDADAEMRVCPGLISIAVMKYPHRKHLVISYPQSIAEQNNSIYACLFASLFSHTIFHSYKV